ncbi:hypothetical protein [Vibrio barjaei]|uniref:hypothetical protein n=1 Tax=Vibrio barjaei TaxID=1676683 RepID=UPI002283DBE7|nr:hypothetical protein [Vibrio barjaei]MCY9872355.1 hypothetical protein [Vibrio barjaei]
MEYECDKCGVSADVMDLGYLGPKERDFKGCNPFMEMETLCIDCENEYQHKVRKEKHRK